VAMVQGTLNQLSFEVVDPRGEEPMFEEPVPEPSWSSFSLSGELGTNLRQRYLKNRLVVQLIDPTTGEIIAQSKAVVSNVSFPVHDSSERSPAWTERRHKVKVGDPIEIEAPAEGDD